MKTTQLILALLILVALGGGAYLFTQSGSESETSPDNTLTDTMPVEPTEGLGDGAEALISDGDYADTVAPYASELVLGQSVDGVDIVAHQFGTGVNEVLLITGVHGADARNTTALGDGLVSYFANNQSAVPEGMRVTIVPNLNPDGLANGSRFNANNVDLNRNFACDWASVSQWRDQEVSGGSAAFSEPEAVAIRDYVSEVNLAGAVVWFAAEGKVYPSACESVPSSTSAELAASFASAADYGVEAEFDAYEINGDMVNWLAGEGVPAISVLLTDRQNTELAQNLAGVEAILTTLSRS